MNMITIQTGTVADTENVIELMAYVKQQMQAKEWLYLDLPDEIRKMMRNGTMSLWVAKDGEHIIGAFDTLHPGFDFYNYGYLIGLSPDELVKVINMDTAVVHPDYRGNGLQRRMMETAERELRKTGEHILMCTVHPENIYSLNNVLKQGYTICKTMELYGSVRHVLMKKIGEKEKCY